MFGPVMIMNVVPLLSIAQSLGMNGVPAASSTHGWRPPTTSTAPPLNSGTTHRPPHTRAACARLGGAQGRREDEKKKDEG